MSKKANVTWACAIEPQPVTWAWMGNFESVASSRVVYESDLISGTGVS